MRGALKPRLAKARRVGSRIYLLKSALRTFGGDIGSSVILTPVARYKALAAAAGGGTIETSPTPLTPSGWSGWGT